MDALIQPRLRRGVDQVVIEPDWLVALLGARCLLSLPVGANKPLRFQD